MMQALTTSIDIENLTKSLSIDKPIPQEEDKEPEESLETFREAAVELGHALGIAGVVGEDGLIYVGEETGIHSVHKKGPKARGAHLTEGGPPAEEYGEEAALSSFGKNEYQRRREEEFSYERVSVDTFSLFF